MELEYVLREILLLGIVGLFATQVRLKDRDRERRDRFRLNPPGRMRLSEMSEQRLGGIGA